MKKRTNIFSKLQSTGKALLLLSKLALAAVILAAAVPQSVYAADTQTQGSSYKSAKDYYNAQESVSIKKDVTDILDRPGSTVYIANSKLGDIKNELEKLRNAANGELIWKAGQVALFNTAQGQYLNKGGVDSKMEDVVEDLRDAVNDALERKQITEQQAKVIMAEGARLYNVGADRAIEAYKADGKKDCGALGIDCEERIETARRDTLSAENLRVGRQCATIDELRQKYQSGGCWSCMVVEKLVSAFLKVAGQAYDLAQRAGLIVLGIGAVLWLLMWGLKNVSSLTQVVPGNILNDLVKFAFKIALAYIFITAGLKAVSTYFINPLMGTGAVIARNSGIRIRLNRLRRITPGMTSPTNSMRKSTTPRNRLLPNRKRRRFRRQRRRPKLEYIPMRKNACWKKPIKTPKTLRRKIFPTLLFRRYLKGT